MSSKRCIDLGDSGYVQVQAATATSFSLSSMMELRLGSARYLTRGRHWPACLGLHAPEDGHRPLADMLSRVAEVHGHPRQMGTAQLTPCVTCMLPRQPVPVAAWLEQASSLACHCREACGTPGNGQHHKRGDRGLISQGGDQHDVHTLHLLS